ncbi:MAG: divergent polysaccharide deacetylase family protein [Deltaproteobacteria bacterium]|nr:divergent polysaccharide deacetylase family protein [Deltaproteobacteria bacterium]
MARKRRGKGMPAWVLWAIGLIIGAAVVIAFFNYRRPAPAPGPVVPPPIIHRPPPVVVPPAPPVTTPVPPVAVAPLAGLPRLAIVIDDMGQDLRKLDELSDMGVPITIAVLPHLVHSTDTAVRAHKRGMEVILHLPMEPKSDENDPGKGALWTAMTPDEVRGQMDGDIKAVPYAIGMNNHMGSKFTEDGPLMREVLAVAKKKRLFFLDSRTTPNSVASGIAREMGVATSDRDVFLDNERDVVKIKARIAEAVRLARKRGSAIAIGHPYPETIKALQESVSTIDGVEVVRLSVLLK